MGIIPFWNIFVECGNKLCFLVLRIILNLSFVFMIATNPSYGAEPSHSEKKITSITKPGHLKIFLEWHSKLLREVELNQEEVKQKFLATCKSLGENFIVAKGSFGSGIFSDYSCWLGSKKLYGNDAKISGILGFELENNAVVLKMAAKYFLGVKKVSFPLSSAFFDFFTDGQFTDMLSLSLLDDAPLLGFLEKEKFNTDEKIIFRKIAPSTVKHNLPQSLLHLGMYNVFAYKPARKKSELARAKVIGFLEPKTEQDEMNHASNIVYNFVPDGPRRKAVRGFWIHSKLGPGEVSKILKPNIEIVAKLLGEKFNAPIKKGLVIGTAALRFGFPIVKSPQILKKSRLFSLILEARPTGYGGFRLYYDLLPKIQNLEVMNDLPINTEIGYSRLALGWAFGFYAKNYTFGLFDYIDFSPKVSLWNFKLKQSVKDIDENDQSYDFNIVNQRSLGWDVAVEKNFRKILFKAWYGADFLGFLSRLEGGYTIKMNRFGADAWIRGPKLSQESTLASSFLLFLVYENQTFSKKNQSTGEESPPVTLTSGYAGAGFGLQW